jgi:hypothetical protein
LRLPRGGPKNRAMQSSGLTILALTFALAGCGARNTLEIGSGASGDAGAPTPRLAHMKPCMIGSIPALMLTVGTPTCAPVHVGLPPVFSFFISGADLAGLSPGSMLTVVNETDAGTQGNLYVGMTETEWLLIGGTLDFTTLVQGVSATGSFDVTWAIESMSGTFTADECPADVDGYCE